MKKLLILLLALAFYGTGFCQANYVWQKIDSVAKSKEQIYQDTKLFIAETWRGASSSSNAGSYARVILTGAGSPIQNLSEEKHTIMTEDKETGTIIVKGEMEYNLNFMMNPHLYKYTYMVRFYTKDNKYKMVIDEVHCISAKCQGKDWPLVEPCENENCPKYGKTSLPQEQLFTLMNDLRNSLQNIVTAYATHIQKPSATNGDW